MFVVWPDHIPANTYSLSKIHMADILPTLGEVLGIVTDSLRLDGQSRWSAWTDPRFQDRDALVWQMDLYTFFQNQGPKPEPYATTAVVQGTWKLLADSLQPTELFNLATDHRELYNLLDEHPDVVKELSGRLTKFLRSERDASGFAEQSNLRRK